jgi:hypothetical protein
MRSFGILLIIVLLFCNGKCRKEVLDYNGLPPATQEGKNTFGFLLNGKPWIPSGFNGGTGNLSLDIDFGFKNGIFGIAAYQRVPPGGISGDQSISIGIADSLKFVTIPAIFLLGKNTLYGIYYVDDKSRCEYAINYATTDTTIYRTGKLTITKLDKIQGVIAGTFSATLAKPGCDTVKITEGRFDMKF